MSVKGRDEIAALAAAATQALKEAELTDELRMLETRVFGRSSELLFESRQIRGRGWRWAFKPIVELLLRHLVDVAPDEGRPREARQREIRWAIEMSGF
jgi:hypothetical protein